MGEAAPIMVSGAMPAAWAARVIMLPAEAAIPPLGET
jgi:hypothetical protein